MRLEIERQAEREGRERWNWRKRRVTDKRICPSSRVCICLSVYMCVWCLCVCQSARAVCVVVILAVVRLRDSQRKPVLVQFTVNDSLPAPHSPAGHWPNTFVCMCMCLLRRFIGWPGGKGWDYPVNERSQVVKKSVFFQQQPCVRSVSSILYRTWFVFLFFFCRPDVIGRERNI